MDPLFIILTGLLQGLTEFLPISSSGHLSIFEKIPYFQNSIFMIEKNFSLLIYNLFLHIGTLCAVCIFYRKDILLFIVSIKKYLFYRSFKKLDKTSSEYLLILSFLFFSCIPIVFAIFLEDYVSFTLNNLYYIALFYLFNAVILFLLSPLSFLYPFFTHRKKIYNLSIKTALLVGLFQLFAIFPGISRSGITILACMICGLEIKESIRYSFLLSIPILLGGFLIKVPLFEWNIVTFEFLTFLSIGFFIAFFFGLLSIYLLYWFVEKQKFHYFGIYSLILSCLLFFSAFSVGL